MAIHRSLYYYDFNEDEDRDGYETPRPGGTQNFLSTLSPSISNSQRFDSPQQPFVNKESQKEQLQLYEMLRALKDLAGSLDSDQQREDQESLKSRLMEMYDHVFKQSNLARSKDDQGQIKELYEVVIATIRFIGGASEYEDNTEGYKKLANKLLAQSSYWKKKLAGIMLAVLGAVAIGFGIAIALGTFGLGVGPGVGIAVAGAAGYLAGYSLFAKGRDAQRADYRYSLGHDMQNIIEARESPETNSYIML